MALAPTARAWLDQLDALGLPPIQQLPLAQSRQMARTLSAALSTLVPVGRVEDRLLARPGGPLAVRLYWPEAPAPHCTVVYAHGGGFVRGDLDPDGHPKLLHLWPVKLLQAGRSDGDYTGVTAMREAASFKR